MRAQSRIVVLFLLAIVLLSVGLTVARETPKVTSVPAKVTYKSLQQNARAMKALYKWQLQVVQDLTLAEQQLTQLRQKRLAIQKEVEKLEYLLRMRERKGTNPEIGFAPRQEVPRKGAKSKD